MIREKHRKLLHKFLGNIARPRYTSKSKLVKLAKLAYLGVTWPVEIVGDILFAGRHRNRAPLAHPRRILIVKPDQLGDVLFSTFLLPIIKSVYPAVEIDYLVNPKAQAVLRGNPHVANIYTTENIFLEFLPGRGHVFQLPRIMRRNRAAERLLRERRYDAVIHARAYPPSSNIRWRKLGGALIAFDIAEQSFLADYWADYDLDEEEWKNYLNLLPPLGIDISRAEFREEFYDNNGANPMAGAEKYAVISPLTFDRERSWHNENWKELVAFLTGKGMYIALTGTPAQKNALNELAAAGGGKAKVFADMKLADFGALMKGAAFFVGIDSFPAHLALASGKPVFALVNVDLYFLKGYSPAGLKSDARCMLPVIPGVTFFNVKAVSAQELQGSLPAN